MEKYVENALRTESPVTIGVQYRLLDSARLIHGVVGLATEVGELQDVVKKHVFYGKPFDYTNAIEELGDLLWYVAILCDALEVTLPEVMDLNIAKLRQRYPDKFTEQDALHRDLAKEREILDGAKQTIGDPRPDFT